MRAAVYRACAKAGWRQPVGAPRVNGPFEFVDTRNNKRAGKVYTRPPQAVAAGIAVGWP